MSIILVTSSVLVVVLSLIYFITQNKYNYWKKKNIPHLKPTPFFGNYGDYILMKKLPGLIDQKICQTFPKEPYVGAYYGIDPALIVQDPDIIKLITTKDFAYFNAREIQDHVHKENIGNSLFLTGGDRWKVVRQHMTPLFTSAKMRNMYHLIEKCCHEFENMLDREFKKSNVREVRSLMGRFTMDCISSCGFGVNSNTLNEANENNIFFKIGESIFDISNYRCFLMILRSMWPRVFFGLGLTSIPPAVTAFFHQLVVGVFEQRNYTPTNRNDFIDLIMSWTKKENLTSDGFKFDDVTEPSQIKLKVDNELLVAQSNIFFGAGFETSASTLSYTLYELAKNPKEQERAIEEVDAYLLKNNNKLDYNCVTDLPYLNACLDETLRLYPVLSLLTRELVRDYKMPSGLHLDKGVRIHLPIYHMHHNPENFPEPEQFRPERFNSENKHLIKPYTYMPFGEGPRICIGK